MHPWLHFKTITRHKLLVMKYCFRIGLYKQGLLHDLSKYSPAEFLVGCKYYQAQGAQIMQKGRTLGFPPPGFIIKEETSIILNTGWTIHWMESM